MTEQEQFKHAKQTVSDWLKEEVHWESPYLTFDDVKVIEKALEEQDKHRWIHVSERFPNKEECIKNNCVFIVSNGHKSYAEWFDAYDCKLFGEPTMDFRYGKSCFRIDANVIAWMQLPKPYQQN